MEPRPNLKPTEWEGHLTSNILLTRSFLEVGGNPIPGLHTELIFWPGLRTSTLSGKSGASAIFQLSKAKGRNLTGHFSFLFFLFLIEIYFRFMCGYLVHVL